MSYHGQSGGDFNPYGQPLNVPPPYGYVPVPGGFPGPPGFPPPPMNVPPPPMPTYAMPYEPNPVAPSVNYSAYENRQDSRSSGDYVPSRGRYDDPYSAKAPSDRKYSPAPDTSVQPSRGHDRSSYRDPRSDVSEEPRRRGDSTSNHEREYRPSSKQTNISLDELLKDERLKNVLFAGLSKATAKLEQSLATSRGDTPENVAFIDDSPKGSTSQLFPAAGSSSDPSQKPPKSILKRKMTSSASVEDENSNESFSKLSALEKTLQLLRGKSNAGVSGSSDRMKGDDDKPLASRGALGQLASYDDGGDEETYLYSKKDKSPTSSKSKSASRSDLPFWSVSAASRDAEAVKRDTDPFEIQEKLYEQWRQSINKSADDQIVQKADSTIPQVDPFFRKKIQTHRMPATSGREEETKDNEELDSTVQNILQSIGFNFDLSKRMQELARQKKKKQEEMQGGIIDKSASFLGQGGELVDDLRASLFKDEQEKASIENLIREARASAQKGRSSHDRSLSPGKWSDQARREKSTGRRNRSPDGRESISPDRFRDMGRSSIDKYENRKRSPERTGRHTDWETSSPVRSDEGDTRRRDDSMEDRRQHQSYMREGNAAAPPQGRHNIASEESRFSSRGLSDRKSHPTRISERLKDEPKDEYFYPEDNDYPETASAMPLLTSFSSRRREETQSSGLFPTMKRTSQTVTGHVENLRVMSRTIPDDEDDSFTESRRIILPAKSDRRVVHRSPPYQGSRSPEARFSRKRSPSPLSPRMSKERRLYGERDDFQGGRDDGYYQKAFSEREKASSVDYEMKITTFRGRSPDRRDTPSPHYSPDRQSWSRYKSPPSRSSDREKDLSPRYPQGQPGAQVFDRLQSPPVRKEVGRFSPDRKRSPLRGDYYEKEGRRRSSDRRHSRSPGRYRSRSPDRRRSRSPYGRRYRSRSPDRRRRSPERRRSPGRRYSPGRDRRRSPGRRRSFERRRSDARRGPEKEKGPRDGEKKNDSSKFKIDRRDKPSEKPKVDVSKMSPEERKAYLTKLLEEKGQTVDEAKQNLLGAIETLTNVTPEQRKTLIQKMAQVTPEERQRMMHHLSLRQVKVTALKAEVEKLKKEQNELMRKCQRSGLGNDDPSLRKNAEDQTALEQEIQRLSVADLFVPLEVELRSSPPPSHPPPENAKEVKKIPAPMTTSKKAVLAAGKEQKSGQVTSPMTSAEGVKSASSSSQENWKSVTVGEENKLPEIGDITKIETGPKSKPEEGKKKSTKETKQDTRPSYSSGKQKVYYEYHDSGNHWCKNCSSTCNSLDQLFQHCHGKKHLNNIEHEKRPWKDSRKDQKSSSQKVGIAQTRRIKGAEMMFPVVGFYCSLCKVCCYDFNEASDHLKSDSHYDKYMDFVKQNSMYEKKLLLEKTTALSVKKQMEKSKPPPPPEPPKEPPPPPPPPPPSAPPAPKEKKGKSEKTKDKGKAKKQLRVTGKDQSQDSDEEEVIKDNTDVVDMELDDDEEEESEREIKSKVPKLTAKPASLLPSWTSLASEGGSSSVDMKESKEDDNKPLDQFLTIKTEASEERAAKLPVLGEISVSDIPVPQGPRKMEDSDLPPLPPEPSQPAEPDTSVCTVKSRSEILAEEKKIINEEKMMMGIDVEAEEEQPLAVIPVPPPAVSAATDDNEKSDTKKAKPSLDSLFAKLSRNVAHKTKPKTPTASSLTPSVSEIEQQIQEEIKAKLAKEKMKMLKMKQKEEQKKQEEGKPQRKMLDDSSSSEESDDSYEEEMNAVENAPISMEEGQVIEQKADVQAASPGFEQFPSHPTGEQQDLTTTVSTPQNIYTEVGQPESTQTDTQACFSTDVKSATDLVMQITSQDADAETRQPELIQTVTQTIAASDANLTTESGMLTPEIEAHGAHVMAQPQQVQIEGKTIGSKELPFTMQTEKGKPMKEATKLKAMEKRGKKKGKSPDDVSDLSAFFAATEVTFAKAINVPTKKSVKRGGLRKSGKAKTTSTMPEEGGEELDEESLAAMFGEGMIVLSEVHDEEEGSRHSVTEADHHKGENIDPNEASSTALETKKLETGMTVPQSEVASTSGTTEGSIVDDQNAPDLAQSEISLDMPIRNPSRGRGRGRGKKSGPGRGRRKKAGIITSTKSDGDMDVSVSEEPITDSVQVSQSELAIAQSQDSIQPPEELAESGSVKNVAEQFQEEPSVRLTRSTRTSTRNAVQKRQTRSRTRNLEQEETQPDDNEDPSISHGPVSETQTDVDHCNEDGQDTEHSVLGMQSDVFSSETEVAAAEVSNLKSDDLESQPANVSAFLSMTSATNTDVQVESEMVATCLDVTNTEMNITWMEDSVDSFKPFPNVTERVTDCSDMAPQTNDSDSDATITEETDDPSSRLQQMSDPVYVVEECQLSQEATADTQSGMYQDIQDTTLEMTEEIKDYPGESQQPSVLPQMFTDESREQPIEGGLDDSDTSDQSKTGVALASLIDARCSGQPAQETWEEIDETDSASKPLLSTAIGLQNNGGSSSSEAEPNVEVPPTDGEYIEVSGVQDIPEPVQNTPGGQGKDPPMSGVVSELEESDSMMVSEDVPQEAAIESEISPTAGLSFGLDEDEDSMEFAMADLQNKMEHVDE